MPRTDVPKDVMLNTRVPCSLAERVDDWASERGVSRSEAMRALLIHALDDYDGYPGERRDLVNSLDGERQEIAHTYGTDSSLFQQVNTALLSFEIPAMRAAMRAIEWERRWNEPPPWREDEPRCTRDSLAGPRPTPTL